MFHFDQHLTERIRSAGQPTLRLWIFLASHGIWGFGLVIGFSIITEFGNGIGWFALGIPVIMTHLLVLGVQQIVRRERPPIAVSKIIMWRRTPSFPSAHSAGAMALAVTMSAAVLPFGEIGVVLAVTMVLLALGIGVSRIIVGVHYLTDVLAGFLFGTLVTGIFLSVL